LYQNVTVQSAWFFDRAKVLHCKKIARSKLCNFDALFQADNRCAPAAERDIPDALAMQHKEG
jgi:hypothetical protein